MFFLLDHYNSFMYHLYSFMYHLYTHFQKLEYKNLVKGSNHIFILLKSLLLQIIDIFKRQIPIIGVYSNMQGLEAKR